MIADGASILLFGERIADCYKGKTVEKPEFDFYDYMQSYENLKKSDRYKEDERYWTSKVDTFPECVQLPYRILPSDVQKPVFRRLSKTLNSDQWNKLKDISKAKGVTTASMLCSAYSRALSKFSGSNNFGINLTMFNRYPFYKDIENIIGDFTSTVILDIKTEKDFWEQTKAIQKNMFEGIEHRSYDGVDFIKQLSKKGGNPLSAVMPVVFTCAIFDDKLHGWNDLGKIQYIISQTPQVALDNQTTAMDGELHITWDFVDQLFEPEMIQALFDGYTGILEQLCNEAENPTITSDELVSSVTAYNNTKKDIPLSTLDSLFEERVLKSRDKTAVVCENTSVTYSQLNSMANQVANYLFENNYNKCGVAVSGEKCIEIIAAIMGILKAGCYYVPVAVDVPPARQKYILENSNSSLLIDRKFLNNNIFGSYSNEFCEKTHHIDDIAYIIYTSGSTGTPKGVVIKHSAACNTILDINEKFNVNENDNIIGISSLYFDLSVYDIFGALSTGASLVLVKDQRNVNEIKHILRTNHITFWNSVPAILDMTVSSMDDNETYEDMRHILLSGDWIPLDLFDKAKKKFPNCDVTSLGGATEASIWSIYYPINKVEEHWKSIPYGYPLANQTCYVLDKNLEMCPFSVPGELYIGGIGLANGYCGREKETAQHFIVHPELGALYRTGDNAVYTKEGYIEFLGRIDSQVKVNGYRIELDEISNTLKQSLCVKDAISFVQKDGKSSSIVSYIIPATKKIRSNDNQESIIKSGAESAEILPAELSPKRYAELSELLEKESLGTMLDVIRTFNSSNSALGVYEINDFVKKNKIREHYTKLMRQWFNELVKCGCAEKTGTDTYEIINETQKNYSAGIREEFTKVPKIEFFRESLDYMDLCRKNIVSILRGEETILNLLFPKGEWNVADNLYKTNPIAKYYNSIVSSVINKFTDVNSDRKVNILEAGAGVGGTTAAVLKSLKDKNVAYTFTDLSTLFTDKAKEVYKEYSFIDYNLFDIDVYPQEQGYPLEGYDIILIANAMHDAKNAKFTLHNLNNMLTPNGILIILETTSNTKLQMVTSSLIDGFSNYNDFRLEQNTPMLSAEKWKQLLIEEGYKTATAFPDENSEAALYGQSVIVAQKASLKNFLSDENIDEIKKQSGEMLPKYMMPSQIIQMDKFPLSANGKITQKLFPKPIVNTSKETAIVKPSTETEQKLYEKWKNILNTEDFGVTDDFYSVGGDSLKAVQLLSELNADKEIDIRHFFDGSNIRDIAAYLDSENIDIA